MRYLFFFLYSIIFSTAFTQQRPNIIYIMSDDHDGKAISAYNKTLIQTPNIDRIANKGMINNRTLQGIGLVPLITGKQK